jgi:hypothetical protein
VKKPLREVPLSEKGDSPQRTQGRNGEVTLGVPPVLFGSGRTHFRKLDGPDEVLAKLKNPPVLRLPFCLRASLSKNRRKLHGMFTSL